MIIKKEYIITVSIIMGVSLFSGCANQKKAKPTVVKPAQVQKPVHVEAPKPSGITLDNIQSSNVNSLALKGKHQYKQGESIQFIVDTKDKVGYLYLIYLDKKGQTTLLYPNPNAPLSEMSGRYIFPNDFGNMNIRATKDCKDCKEDITNIYALFSKKPILDIKNITKKQLLSIAGEIKTKGLSMDLGGEQSQEADVNIAKFEFAVE